MEEIDFSGFFGREKALSKITRFSMYETMYYRQDLLFHSQRVTWMLEDILTEAKAAYGDALDEKKLLTLSLVHDDAEIVTGDVQLGHKVKMTPEQLAQVDRAEEQAIEELAARWPEKVNGYAYRELLAHALHKDCLEARLVGYADKVEGQCESLHEVFAGNPLFEHPASIYAGIVPKLPQKFPELAKLVPGKNPLLQPAPPQNWKAIIAKSKPHTEQSVRHPSGIPCYDRWKEITIVHGAIDRLVEKKE